MIKLSAIARLTRIEHSIMLIAAVISAEIISGVLQLGEGRIIYLLLLSIITAVFISMGSFAINDYYDVNADIANKRMNRPIVRGTITKKQALAIAAISFSIGVIASAFINIYALVIAAVFALIGFVYSYKTKEMLLVGNVCIALSMAIPFLYGNLVVSNVLLPSIITIFLMIFLAGLAREIHGMIRDYKGDIKARNVMSLVRQIGAERSATLALILYIEAIAISVFMFFFIWPFAYNIVYLLPIILSDALLLYVSIGFIMRRTRKFFDSARNISLCAMALALVAFVASALVHIAI